MRYLVPIIIVAAFIACESDPEEVDQRTSASEGAADPGKSADAIEGEEPRVEGGDPNVEVGEVVSEEEGAEDAPKLDVSKPPVVWMRPSDLGDFYGLNAQFRINFKNVDTSKAYKVLLKDTSGQELFSHALGSIAGFVSFYLDNQAGNIKGEEIELVLIKGSDETSLKKFFYKTDKVIPPGLGVDKDEFLFLYKNMTIAPSFAWKNAPFYSGSGELRDLRVGVQSESGEAPKLIRKLKPESHRFAKKRSLGDINIDGMDYEKSYAFVLYSVGDGGFEVLSKTELVGIKPYPAKIVLEKDKYDFTDSLRAKLVNVPDTKFDFWLYREDDSYVSSMQYERIDEETLIIKPVNQSFFKRVTPGKHYVHFYSKRIKSDLFDMTNSVLAEYENFLENSSSAEIKTRKTVYQIDSSGYLLEPIAFRTSVPAGSGAAKYVSYRIVNTSHKKESGFVTGSEFFWNSFGVRPDHREERVSVTGGEQYIEQYIDFRPTGVRSNTFTITTSKQGKASGTPSFSINAKEYTTPASVLISWNNVPSKSYIYLDSLEGINLKGQLSRTMAVVKGTHVFNFGHDTLPGKYKAYTVISGTRYEIGEFEIKVPKKHQVDVELIFEERSIFDRGFTDRVVPVGPGIIQMSQIAGTKSILVEWAYMRALGDMYLIDVDVEQRKYGVQTVARIPLSTRSDGKYTENGSFVLDTRQLDSGTYSFVTMGWTDKYPLAHTSDVLTIRKK